LSKDYIKGPEEIAYKERLKAFMAEINPKPSLETIEKMKTELLKAREKK
jgi:hypothetical protein